MDENVEPSPGSESTLLHASDEYVQIDRLERLSLRIVPRILEQAVARVSYSLGAEDVELVAVPDTDRGLESRLQPHVGGIGDDLVGGPRP